MTDTLPATARRLLPYLPHIANAVLVIMIGLAAARLFWLLWPTEPLPVTAGLAVHRPGSDAAASVNVDTIIGAHLFGEKAAPDRARGREIKAPETRLNLTLTGIVSSRSGARSRALIRDDRQRQSAYAVGETVAAGVTLHAIYVDRVILDRGGRYETLTLEREKNPEGVRRVTRNEQVTGDAVAELGNVRREILSDPAKISQYIRLQPVRRNGTLVGYRIYPGQKRELFQELGLESGETVTAVNGVALDNAGGNMQALRALSEAGNVSVTLERGGEQRTMSVSFQ